MEHSQKNKNKFQADLNAGRNQTGDPNNNATLHRITQRLEGLHKLDLAILSAQSVENLAGLALDHATTLVPCVRATITTVDLEAGTVFILAVYSERPTAITAGHSYPIDWALVGPLENQPFVVFQDFDRSQDSSIAQLHREGIRSVLSVGLRVENRLIGLLNFSSHEVDTFTSELIDITLEIANQVAIGVFKAQLTETLVRRATELEQSEKAARWYAQRLEMVHQIDRSLIAGSSVEELLHGTLENIRQLIPCQRADIDLIDTAKNEVMAFSTHFEGGRWQHAPLPPGFVESFDAQNLRVVDDLRDLQENPLVETLMDEGFLSSLNILLKCEDQAIGSLGLLATTSAFFTPEYQEAARDIGSHLATAIHQIQLSEELPRRAARLEDRVLERTAELQATNDRLSAILNNSRDGILLVDRNLNIEQSNPSFAQLTGGILAAPVRNLLDYLDEQDAARVRTSADKAVAGQTPEGVEIVIDRQVGTTVELGLDYISGDGLVVTLHDISERKQAERELRYHASIQENMSDAVIVTDIDLHIQSWNKAAERIYGWSESEVLGRISADIVQSEFSSPGERQQVLEKIKEGSWWQAEVVQQRKDGSRVYILGSVTVIRDEDGQPSGIVAVNRDITERKLVESALQQYAAEVEDLYNNAPAGYHSLDKEATIIRINDTELRWLGYSRDEVLGKLKITDLLTPSSVDIFRQIFPVFKERGWQNDVELEMRRKDGSTFPILVNATAIYDATGQYVQSRSTVVDITEIKAHEEALRCSEEQFHESQNMLRLVLDTIPVRVFWKDTQSVYLGCNRLCAQDAGLNHPSEIIGKTDFELAWHPEAAGYRADDRAIVETGIAKVGYEEVQPTASGTNIIVQTTKSPLRNTDNAIIGVLGSSVDITERKQAEAELKTLSQRLQLATEAGHIGIWDWDMSSDRVLWNWQMYSLYGLPQDQFPGAADMFSNSSLLHPDDFDRMQREVKVAVAGEKPLDTEFRIARPDGTLRHLKSKAVVLRDADGSPMRMIGVNWDITVLKQAEENLQLALDKEKELSDLKSRFVSMASHEFRNPLAVILTLTETLKRYRKGMDEAQIDSRLNKIRQQVAFMTDIMEEVLELARIQAGRLEFNSVPGDLDALFRDLLAEFEDQAVYQGRIVYDCPNPPVDAVFDPRLMRQVVGNLTHNALKYSPVDKRIFIQLVQDEAHIQLQVKDEGIGIPAADLKHLFEPFHRASNVRTIHGTGLGMSITKQAVELHGGTIDVESQVGIGTTVTVVIPKST